MIEGIKDLYSEIIENRQELVCQFDADTRLLMVNEAYARAFNSTKEKLIGQRFLELVPQEEHEKIKAHLANLTKRNPEVTYQHPVTDDNGNMKWQEWYDRAVFSDSGELLYFISIGRDVTEQYLMVQKLQQQDKFQKLIMEMAIGLVTTPPGSVDKKISEGLEKIGHFTGVDRVYVFQYDNVNELINNTHEWCGEGISPEIDNLQGIPWDAVPVWVESHFKGEVQVYEDVLSMPENDPIRKVLEPQAIRSIITVPAMYSDECLGFVGFDAVRETKNWSQEERQLLDIMAGLIANAIIKKETESQMINARHEAEAANEAKSRFLASLSHEIHTPLNGILGMSDMLTKSNPDERQKRYIDIIQSSGNTLKSIVSDILDLYKSENEDIEHEKTDFSIRDVIRESIQLLESKAGEQNNVMHEGQIESPWAYVNGARQHVKQVLINLINNAVKFTRDGTIHVEAKPAAIRHEEGVVYMKFCVEDTGTGISNDRLSRFFKSGLVPAHDLTNKKGKGVGLGLLISKNLVDRMHGRIEIESEEGKGTRVSFTVPLQIRGTEKTVIENENQDKPAGKGLMVTDRKLNSVFLEQQMSLMDYHLDYAAGILEAEELLEQVKDGEESYQIILIDLVFGPEDVLQFVDRIKDQPRFFAVKVVLIATSVSQMDRAWISKHDLFDILVRPIKTYEIERILNYGGKTEYWQKSARAPFKASDKPQHPDSVSASVPSESFDETPYKFSGSVLVAEDNSVNQMLLEFILRKLEVDFKMVENGKEVLEAVGKKEYDLILMDCHMPVLDGFSATSQLRKISDNKNTKVPVIAITANAVKGFEQKCIAAGMDEFITKPYTANEIIAIFKKYLHVKESVEKSSEPVDMEVLLNNFDQDKKLIKKLIGLFITDTRKQTKRLRDALKEKNYTALKDINHSIKGASANLSILHVLRITDELSSAINSRDDQSISALTKKIYTGTDFLEEWWLKSFNSST